MPDHDPDHLRKFRRDRINELGLVRIGTDRQTTTTTARLSPLSPAIVPTPNLITRRPRGGCRTLEWGDPP